MFIEMTIPKLWIVVAYGGGAAMKGGAGSFNICKILFLQSHGAYIILFFLSSLFVCICRKYVPYKKCLILMLVQRINELDQGKGEKVSYFYYFVGLFV